MTEKLIVQRPLPYQDLLASRLAVNVDLVVIHCTELPDLATAREYGERICHEQSQTGNSGHFYIDRDGATECWVDPLRVAHHVRHYNQRSIGIELVNQGRWPDWYATGQQTMREEYTGLQTQALIRLLQHLADEFPGLIWIAGHEDLDRDQVPSSNAAGEMVFRKRDPGPLFPWREVLESASLKRLVPEP